MSLRTRNVLVLLPLVGTVALAPAQHLGDLWVGRSAAGQIAISPGGYVPDLNYHELSPVSGLLNGWTDDDPGFDHLTASDPNNGLLTLAAGAQIWLQILAIDPAFRLIDNSFNILDAPGQSTFLGGYNLHTHNTWHINSDDPAYDPQQCVWHISVFLRDVGGTAYTPSVPFTFSFTNVFVRPIAEPATGNFDQTGGVGLTDWHAIEECLSGPGALPSPDNPAITTCEVTCLNAFDVDNDADLDLLDFASFQAAYTGN